MGAAVILAGFIYEAASAMKLDKTFLADAIQINLAEISVGDLAQKNGGTDKVKSFGKMLVDDHTASNTKSCFDCSGETALLTSTEPKAADKKKYDELKKLSGVEFDRRRTKAVYIYIGGCTRRLGLKLSRSSLDRRNPEFPRDQQSWHHFYRTFL